VADDEERKAEGRVRSAMVIWSRRVEVMLSFDSFIRLWCLIMIEKKEEKSKTVYLFIYYAIDG